MKFQNLDLEKEMVEHVFFDEITTVALREVYARRLVIMYMDYNGPLRDTLTEAQHNYIYNNLCDGFGLGSQPEYYDWSHVRDSSWGAFLNIIMWLDSQHKLDFENCYQTHLQGLRYCARELSIEDALESIQ